MILLADVLTRTEEELDSFAAEVDRHQSGGIQYKGAETLSRTLQSLTAGRDLAVAVGLKLDHLIHRLETSQTEELPVPELLPLDSLNNDKQIASDLRSFTILQDIGRLEGLISQIPRDPPPTPELVRHMQCTIAFLMQNLDEVPAARVSDHLRCISELNRMCGGPSRGDLEFLMDGHLQKIMSGDVNLRALVSSSYSDIVEWCQNLNSQLNRYVQQLNTIRDDELVRAKQKNKFVLAVIPIIAQTLQTISHRTADVARSYSHSFLRLSFLELSVAEQEARLGILESGRDHGDSEQPSNIIVSSGVMNETALRNFTECLDQLDATCQTLYDTDLSVATLPLLTQILFGFVAYKNDEACKLFRQDLRDYLTMSPGVKESIEKLTERLNTEVREPPAASDRIDRFALICRDLKTLERNLPLMFWLKNHLTSLNLLYTYTHSMVTKAAKNRGITDAISKAEIIENIVNLNFECFRRLLLIFKVEALSLIQSDKGILPSISQMAELISSKLIPIVVNAEFMLLNENLLAESSDLAKSISQMQDRRDVVLRIFATRVCRIAIRQRSNSFLYA